MPWLWHWICLPQIFPVQRFSHQPDQFSELVGTKFVKLLEFGSVLWVLVGWSFGVLFCWDLFGGFLGFACFSFMFWVACLFSFAERWEGWLVAGSEYKKMKSTNSFFFNRSWPIWLETMQNGPVSDSGHQAEELFSTIFIFKWTDFVSWNRESQVKSSLNNWTTSSSLVMHPNYTASEDNLFAWTVKTLQNCFSFESSRVFFIFSCIQPTSRVPLLGIWEMGSSSPYYGSLMLGEHLQPEANKKTTNNIRSAIISMASSWQV